MLDAGFLSVLVTDKGGKGLIASCFGKSIRGSFNLPVSMTASLRKGKDVDISAHIIEVLTLWDVEYKGLLAEHRTVSGFTLFPRMMAAPFGRASLVSSSGKKTESDRSIISILILLLIHMPSISQTKQPNPPKSARFL